ncbi:putative nucleic acid-binding Zn-ribbon protein [Arcanobacterium wilhelmae]|uniref:Nucleic acid-binding Zn-ribbon protein n=1 Tax=Arcanobacterium wilhelmae TaxID=1803177 RepID=A0ABT9N924_9ACTO|nr:hypothetical protein [Arcanobacterium wilhelmae]MDP9800200.1 putative nucleic acid-binding Zn-ribbon protein [Arcanobacterium wilhelmae]WFN89641.1 hypothetical protein P8A24_05380 [Arcanobacterium wilhelmae]
MKAPRTDQLALLDVAALDSQINKLRREDSAHPLRTELAATVNQIASTGREIAQHEATLAAANTEVEEAGAATAKVSAVIHDKEAKLTSGAGMDSRQLLALQKEIDDARVRLAAAEERDFAALEAVDAAEAALAGARARLEVLNTQMVEQRSQLEADVEVITRDVEDLLTKRAALVAPLDGELVALYERSRSRGGFGVIAMYPNGTTSGGIEISPIEAASIKGGDPENVHISDDYDAIVVLANYA